MLRIEKRLSFGFRGEWGKLYKKFDFDEKKQIHNEVIQLNKTNYVELGQYVQLKTISDYEKSKQKILSALTSGSGYLTLETTDAFFNHSTKEFECVINVEDLILFNNQWWKVLKIIEKPIYTPNKQSFYYMEVKKLIDEGVVYVK